MSYASTVLADGPVGYWRLGEASGTTAADQQSANPGAYGAGVTLGQAGATGDGDTAVANGSNTTNAVSIPNAAALSITATPSVSVEIWWKRTATGSAAGLIRKNNNYGLLRTASGNPRFLVGVAASARTLDGPSIIPMNVWTHIVGTYDGTTMRLYVNGSLVASSTAFSGNITNGTTAALVIGGDNDGTNGIGQFDDAAVYNTVLSDAQVAAHYAAAASSPPASPAALSGAGSLTSTATPAQAGTAVLAGAGALTAAGSPADVGTAALSGAGTLAAAGTPADVGTAALSGAGTLTAAGTPQERAAATLSGSGTLAAIGSQSSSSAASLGGSGVLSAGGRPAQAGSATLSGAGTLTATGNVPAVTGRDRVLVVVSEPRTRVVSAQQRIWTVAAEPRLTLVPQEK